MAKSASVTIRNCGDTVHVRAFTPNTFTARAAALAIDGKPVKSFTVAPGRVEDLSAPVSTLDRYITVTITVDQVTVPEQAVPGSKDGRELGLLVSSIKSVQ